MDNNKLKKAIADEQKELIYMLNEWDPIGILPGEEGPMEEYDCIAGPILSLLHRGENKKKLIIFFNELLKNHIGLEPEDSKPAEIADKIMNWWNKKIGKHHITRVVGNKINLYTLII